MPNTRLIGERHFLPIDARVRGVLFVYKTPSHAGRNSGCAAKWGSEMGAGGAVGGAVARGQPGPTEGGRKYGYPV